MKYRCKHCGTEFAVARSKYAASCPDCGASGWWLVVDP